MQGGSLTELDGASLNILGGTFSDTTFNGDISLSGTLHIQQNFTLNGTMYIGNASGSTFGILAMGDGQHGSGVLSGNGTIVFGGSPGTNYNENTIYNEENAPPPN